MNKMVFLMMALGLSISAHAQSGFDLPVAPDLSLAPGGVSAKNFPAFQTSVKTDETLKISTLEFIAGILASGRTSPHLNCRIQVRQIREERKFSTGSKWVELLEVELFTDHFGPRSIKYAFPLGSQLGRRVINHQEVGTVEEIKIVTPEPYQNWFQFQHDGQRLVWAEIGNMYEFAPCLLK